MTRSGAQALLDASWSTMGQRVSELPIEQQAKVATVMLGLPTGDSGNRQAVRSPRLVAAD